MFMSLFYYWGKKKKKRGKSVRIKIFFSGLTYYHEKGQYVEHYSHSMEKYRFDCGVAGNIRAGPLRQQLYSISHVGSA